MFFLSLRRHILERNTLKNPAEPQPPLVYAHSGHTGVLATLPGSGRPRDSTPTPHPPNPQPYSGDAVRRKHRLRPPVISQECLEVVEAAET